MKIHRLSALISVAIKHTVIRSGIFHFQRFYPKDLRSRYDQPSFRQTLNTTDPRIAAKEVARLNAILESEWARLRENPEASPASLTEQAAALLKDWGLNPKGQGANHPESLDAFYDHVEGRSNAAHDERPLDNLRPVDAHALELLTEGHKPTLRDALDFYLGWNPKAKKESFQKIPRLAVKHFIEAVGDKPLADMTREDVRTWMVKAIENDQSQGTIDRRLKALRAIVAAFIREKELDLTNKFERQTIPAGARPPEKRETFSRGELETIQRACIAADDDIRWYAALLSDTCTRLAEIGGLRLSDICLDHPIPHIKIVDYEGRSLKTEGTSERAIPLVGVALWAAQRIKKKATQRQVYAFPRYMKKDSFNGAAASATLNKWMRSIGVDHVNHEARHTMADRLRDVQCPKEIRDQIGGWARVDISGEYGLGYALERTQEYLIKTVLPSVAIPTP